ncbi:hypothetical protein [Nitrosomonas sp. Nm58]|uniref:hypothetical protein n=1 Tax=Nitrosomonas sp. Nm58 TaxID=200126 RepID=UPI000A7B0100|nr:hypothetical protein [Nitrosomonas sp. Nm58]
MARNAVWIAKTADELRSAQALLLPLLPLELGLSLEQTAIAIGRSKGNTCTLRTNYCKRATGRMAAPDATYPKGDLLVREDWKKTPWGAGSSDNRVYCAPCG